MTVEPLADRIRIPAPQKSMELPEVKVFKKAGADPKVIQVLDQIRDLHRNPLMHPQEFLSMKEAVGLFDIAKSAIASLAEEIEELQKAGVQPTLPLITTLLTAPMLEG